MNKMTIRSSRMPMLGRIHRFLPEQGGKGFKGDGWETNTSLTLLATREL